MITVDGIEIPKVTAIRCNAETNFLVAIEFHSDSRLDGCIDLEKLKEYKPMRLQEESKDEIGLSRIIVDPEELTIRT